MGKLRKGNSGLTTMAIITDTDTVSTGLSPCVGVAAPSWLLRLEAFLFLSRNCMDNFRLDVLGGDTMLCHDWKKSIWKEDKKLDALYM